MSALKSPDRTISQGFLSFYMDSVLFNNRILMPQSTVSCLIERDASSTASSVVYCTVFVKVH